MLRLPHGATSRPNSRRPDNGYGRLPGRPGPDPAWDAELRTGSFAFAPEALLDGSLTPLEAPPIPAHLEFTRRPDRSL